MDTKHKRRRGIYLLPNLFTTAGLFAGFYAIIMASEGRFEEAAIGIFVAMVMDGLDGRVARLTNTQSDFGVQYDSLADLASFGMAPALVMYQWSLAGHGKLGWVAAFIYVAGAALRLARFNTQAGIADKRYFQGLPSPAAAALMAGFVWVANHLGFQGKAIWVAALALTVTAGVMMVSNVRYHSFKGLDLRGRVPFVTILLVVLMFAFIAIDPPTVLFGVFLLYLVSGPVLTLWQIRRTRAGRRSPGTE